jgi:sodium/hydrogen exchanger-like protein 6/7
MLEILGIRTGVVEEIDSDDEFDIENVGAYYKSSRGGMGPVGLPLSTVPREDRSGGAISTGGIYGNSPTPPDRPNSGMSGRRNSQRNRPEQDILGASGGSGGNDSDYIDDDDDGLPPMNPRQKNISMARGSSHNGGNDEGSGSSHHTQHDSNSSGNGGGGTAASGALGQLAGMFGGSDDQAEWFRKIDEGYIKPKLLLDPGKGNGNGGGFGV